MKEKLETVGSFTAERAARLARGISFTRGMKKMSRRLVYYALEKDKHCADGLMLLCGRSDSLEAPVALSLMEYALNTVSGEEQRNYIAQDWRGLLFKLGFLTDATGARATDREALVSEPCELKVDKEAYDDYLAKELASKKSGQAALDAAHILLGVQCGLLQHKELGSVLTSEQFEECYHPERFEKTEAYSVFLAATEMQMEPDE